MPGRSTFTATRRPSRVVALCTTEIDARPIGVSEKLQNASSSGMPRSASTARRTSSKGTGAPVSRHDRNSAATWSPNMPGDEPISWPNFMNVAPSSSKVLRSGLA